MTLGGSGYGGVQEMALVVLVEREGWAQENGHFDRLSAGRLLFSQQSGVQEAATALHHFQTTA